MKILLLNPTIHPSHEINARLKSLGAVVLVPTDADEAWKMVQLHGPSLDLAIIHREPALASGSNAKDDLNLSVIQKIKADAQNSDLPLIVTSSLWNDPEFTRHQQGPQGANAYLHWPFPVAKLISTIEAMFGGSVRWSSSSSTADAGSIGAVPSGSFQLEAVPSEPNPATQAGKPPTGISLIFEPPKPDDPLMASSSDVLASEPTSLSIATGGFTKAIEEDGLEPHERLMLAQQQASANDLALSGPVPEGGTEVISLQPGQPLVQAGDPTAVVSGSKLAMAMALDSDQLQALEMTEPPMVAITRPSEQAETGLAELSPEHEEALAADMPYLFGKKEDSNQPPINLAMIFAEPLGDAVVPGGAVTAPDEATLKKYLLLREQDVAVLSNQLRAARAQVADFEQKLKEANGQSIELRHVIEEHQRKLDGTNRDRDQLLFELQKENEELRFQAKARSDKVRLMESQVKEAESEIERLKERVRIDIRKIRVREKELENKLEIMRKDSEALIGARETKIIELKRKVDLLEFNLDLLQDQYTREKENSNELRARLGRAAQVVRVAGGLLDTPSSTSESVDSGAGKNSQTGQTNQGGKPSGSGIRETA